MLLPLGTDLAAGTLRTLARRQGRAVDPASEEQPGKILHEVRRAEQHLDAGSHLPPSYYGTADATPLWLVLLHDAWRWGLPADQVEELLPNAEAALDWLERYADADGDGFLEYVDSTGRGLSNQGWKDSSDGIRFRDGRIAEAPIALSEVQAYAHEAAVRTADLLEAFGRPGAAHWRRWARDLRQRFRDRFWTEDADGRYPVVALDRDKRPVDSIASNLGHLLGTGLLDETESALVAGRLTAPGMDSGFGLRTRTRPPPASTRWATTPVRSGRTTPPSPCTAWPGPDCTTPPRRWPPGWCAPPPHSTTGCPNSSPATRATGTPAPSRTRPPAAPRPGRPRPPSSSSRHCWGWRRTLPTAVCGCATGSRPDTSRCGSTG
ncbi:hypothetical protein KAURM247S_08503 [Kitasatospora aureofaciens]